VIPDLRLSPVCSARAKALRGQRRTADLIPDWLRVSTWLTFHPAAAIVKAPGSLGCGHDEPLMAAACVSRATPGGARHTRTVGSAAALARVFGLRSGGDAQSKRIGSVATMASVRARIVVASSGPRWLCRIR